MPGRGSVTNHQARKPANPLKYRQIPGHISGESGGIHVSASIRRGAAVATYLHAADRVLNRRAKAVADMALPFYRHFPCGAGPVGFFTLDLRGACSPGDGFFYNRIPKAANSTVMATLAAYSPHRRTFERKPKRAFPRPSRLSGREAAAIAERAYKFTFVRDPYARTLSAYLDKIARGKAQSRHFHRWRGATAEPAFIDFLRFLDDGGLHRDPHWAPQSDLLLLPAERFDFIGKVERLGEDLAQVVARVFDPATEPVLLRAGPRTDTRALMADFYTPEAIRTVNRLFARDFEAFGYERREGAA